MRSAQRSTSGVRIGDEPAERALLARLAAHDRTAMREFYLLYHRRLARFLMRIDDRYGLAEEVINDTMLAIWHQAATFRGDSRVSTWVMGIAWRQGLKSLRTATRAAANSVDPGLGDEVAIEHDAAERGDWLAKAMASLSVDQRVTLELTYYGGYSCEEIADIMGCPRNTVKTRMFYAREKLRELLPALALPTEHTPP